MLFNDFYQKSYKGRKQAAAAKLANGNGHLNGDINQNHIEVKNKEHKYE
jgi:hypothetical protein